MRGDIQKDRQKCRETDGERENLLLLFLLSRAPLKLNLLSARPSSYFTTFPPILSTCHLPLPPHPPVSPPSPASSFSLSLLHHPIHSSFLCHLSFPSPSFPSPDSGRVCRLRHFCQSVCKDQRKVLQCRLKRRLCNAAPRPGQTHTPVLRCPIHK